MYCYGCEVSQFLSRGGETRDLPGRFPWHEMDQSCVLSDGLTVTMF